MPNKIVNGIVELVEKISMLGVSIATVESCTGGMLSQYLTSKPGSSAWFVGGLVTYTNKAKIKFAGVSEQNLKLNGTISQATAEEMARGGLEAFEADISISITGLAGPASDGIHKVGTVWIAWCTESKMHSKDFYFEGDRDEVRLKAVLEACKGIESVL